jgi:NADH:ubiquinone oxidoreductase subunit
VATTRLALGVDIGGVLIQRADGDDDTSFWGENYLETPEVDGAMAAIAALRKERFGDAVYLVSKSGEDTERRAREWLMHNGFYEKTGVRPAHVHFCRKRNDKAPICADLRITHFVDDRLEVLSYLEDVPHKYLLHADEAEIAEYSDFLDQVQRVDSWPDALTAMLRTPA